MHLLMREYEAQELAFRRDTFFPIKIICWAALAIFFYAEQLWRAGTLAIGSLVCSFVSPCVAANTSAGWLWAMFVGRLLLIAGVTWYAIYALAWLSLPGWRLKLAGLGAIIVFPFIFLLVGLLCAVVILRLHLPLEPVFAFENQHLPSWWRQ